MRVPGDRDLVLKVYSPTSSTQILRDQPRVLKTIGVEWRGSERWEKNLESTHKGTNHTSTFIIGVKRLLLHSKETTRTTS